ncbi:hypothetical protein L208DRAFT_1377497 [Tricholoma matsutake]|nr:hypothetical protein L208DRAFT_1377497 [Tricholoma matsutake 945]
MSQPRRNFEMTCNQGMTGICLTSSCVRPAEGGPFCWIFPAILRYWRATIIRCYDKHSNSYLSIVIETFGCSMKMYDLYTHYKMEGCFTSAGVTETVAPHFAIHDKGVNYGQLQCNRPYLTVIRVDMINGRSNLNSVCPPILDRPYGNRGVYGCTKRHPPQTSNLLPLPYKPRSLLFPIRVLFFASVMAALAAASPIPQTSGGILGDLTTGNVPGLLNDNLVGDVVNDVGQALSSPS